MEKKQVLSCIQPTSGFMHLGNYFGAVKNWVDIQDTYRCIYGVVDYHSMTMPYKAQDLRENTWSLIHQLIACGVRIDNLFIQSLVPEHVELCWILSCACSFGELTRMTQFKDKSEQLKTTDKDVFITTGLFTYPVLQAADILIYHADYVPIGKDQEQHLELSRDIAARFNFQYGKPYFVHPEPLYTEIPKLLSLANPEKKMSKSLGEKHYVNLFADEETVRRQVKSAVTDTGETKAGEMSAGVTNLFTLLRACQATEAHDSLMDTYHANTLRYADLKAAVADALVGLTTPMRERLAAVKADKKQVKEQIIDSSAAIRKKAQQTLREVREIAGLTNLRY